MPNALTNTQAVSSLVFQDGFDYYNDLYTKWTSGNIDTHAINAPGRFGYGQKVTVNGQYYGSRIIKALPSATGYSRLVMGVACRIESTSPVPSDTFGFITSTGGPTCAFGFDTLGRAYFTNNPNNGYLGGEASGTRIAQSVPGVIPFAQWFYAEMDVVFSASGNGSVSIRVNGLEVIRQIGITTSLENAGYGIGLFESSNGPTGNSHSFDDIYVLAPQPATPGDSFLGDVKVVGLLPNGAGRVTGFTQTGGISGSNYSSVNDAPPDGDNSYVASNVVGTVDTYRIPPPNAITPVSQVYGVSVYALGRKDDSPSRFISCGVGNGTTENFDAGSPLGSSYAYVQRVFPTNPLTNQPWTLADFDTLQLAIKLVT